MKHIRLLIYTLIATAAACVLPACGGKNAADLSAYGESVYSPEYASDFRIDSAGGKESVMITVSNPWQGADSVTCRLFIARGGESAPDGFSGQILKGNAERIVAMSSTHIAMLDAIGETGRIVGVSGLDYISNPDIQARRDSLADIGYEGNVNYELLMSLNPDIVLLYGVNGANPMVDKLEELGIPYMYVGDYLEESPLGKAEWMVALAELTGNRAKGVETFSGIADRYEKMRSSVHADYRPKVMLNVPYGDSWFLPSTSGYLATLIADAGGEYVYKKDNGNSSVAVDLEEAYRLTSESDVWLNVGTSGSIDELKEACPKFTGVACVKNGVVFNNTMRMNPAGGNDFYESAVVRPDILLRDLIKIFHPGLVKEDFVYYRQLK